MHNNMSRLETQLAANMDSFNSLQKDFNILHYSQIPELNKKLEIWEKNILAAFEKQGRDISLFKQDRETVARNIGSLNVKSEIATSEVDDLKERVNKLESLLTHVVGTVLPIQERKLQELSISPDVRKYFEVSADATSEASSDSGSIDHKEVQTATDYYDNSLFRERVAMLEDEVEYLREGTDNRNSRKLSALEGEIRHLMNKVHALSFEPRTPDYDFVITVDVVPGMRKEIIGVYNHESIVDVKLRIQKQLGVPVDRQYLVAGGNCLLDNWKAVGESVTICGGIFHGLKYESGICMLILPI